MRNDGSRLGYKGSPERAEAQNKEMEEKKDESKKGEDGQLRAEIK